MEKLIIASVAIILLLEGADSQGAGEQCTPFERRRRLLGLCEEGFTCDETDDICKINEGGDCNPEEELCREDTFCDEDDMICKVKAGKGCTPGSTAYCLEHATCDVNGGNLCLCDSGYTANGNLTDCSADGEVKAGKGCTPGSTAYCLEHATCDGNVCQCDSGYTANGNLTDCSADGGQAGVVVSLTLMAASLLACRLF